MVPTFCPLTIWAISQEFCRKPYSLEAGDFLGACYRKAMNPPKAMDFTFSLIAGPSEVPSTPRVVRSTTNFSVSKEDVSENPLTFVFFLCVCVCGEWGGGQKASRKARQKKKRTVLSWVDLSQGRKNSININFLVRISRGHS